MTLCLAQVDDLAGYELPKDPKIQHPFPAFLLPSLAKNSFWKIAQSKVDTLPWYVQKIKTIWQMSNKLWANEISGDLRLRCVSDGYPILQQPQASMHEGILNPYRLVPFFGYGTFIEFLTWWRHQMETFSALLALCGGNPPVTMRFPPQRPVKRYFDVFFDLRLNKRLSKLSRCRWFEALSLLLWRLCYETVPVEL